MAEDRSDERTEAATPRRRQEARERGHVARSADLTTAVVLLAGILALEFMGRRYVNGLAASTVGILERLADVDGLPENLLALMGATTLTALSGLLPLILAVFAAALVANFLQVGFLVTGDALLPKLERLDPLAGLQRIFSIRAAVRLASGLVKLAAVGIVVYASIWSERAALLSLSEVEFQQAVAFGVGLGLTVSLRAAMVLLFLAILEYGYQRWQYERDIRMSRSEIREELKRYEGDPKIRERRRAIQRQLALQRMMQKVPKATVVITNPTHVAVAVEYEPDRMEAPVLTAKGAELLAQRIREIATEHGVPIVERPELARAIYKEVEVGQTIPVELYQAVAEILAYVYRLKNLAVPA